MMASAVIQHTLQLKYYANGYLGQASHYKILTPMIVLLTCMMNVSQDGLYLEKKQNIMWLALLHS